MTTIKEMKDFLEKFPDELEMGNQLSLNLSHEDFQKHLEDFEKAFRMYSPKYIWIIKANGHIGKCAYANENTGRKFYSMMKDSKENEIKKIKFDFFRIEIDYS